MNILLVGDSGVGRSTFINAVANYLKYNNLEEAEENGAEVLIRTSFFHMDNALNHIRIDCRPTTENGEEVENDNEAPKAYEIEWGPAGDRKILRLIDTPSLGDPRGVLHDQENIAKILSFISNYSEIHAIMVFLNSNGNRVLLATCFCIRELLPRFPPSASQNLFFCLTKTRATFYRPGDILPSLKLYLDELGNIIPNQERIFCFDNEAFRYLCARNHGVNFNESQIENFKSSWNNSAKETDRLLKKIGELLPIITEGSGRADERGQ